MNTRWRQVIKFIPDKYDRWEYIGYHEANEVRCPCCGGELKQQSWSEDGPGGYGTVETDIKCWDCNYSWNWSYGYTSLQVGEWSDGFEYSTPRVQAAQIENEFSRQIGIERLRRKSQIRKYYRKLARRG